MRILTHWKIKRLRAELRELLETDRKARDVPGATDKYLPDAMVELGLRIAILRHQISEMEDEE